MSYITLAYIACVCQIIGFVFDVLKGIYARIKAKNACDSKRSGDGEGEG